MMKNIFAAAYMAASAAAFLEEKFLTVFDNEEALVTLTYETWIDVTDEMRPMKAWIPYLLFTGSILNKKAGPD